MRSLQRGILVCCAAVLAATTVATAQPAVTGASGTFSHGQTVTISGSSFGTKTTAAPVVWDNCSTGTYPTDNGKWDGSWPNAGTTAYRTQYTTPIRGIGLPHSNITRYMAGCHGDGAGASDGWDVMIWKNRTVSSYPAYTYVSWYYRADDNWVFGILNPGNPVDDNFKSYDWSASTSPYDNTGCISICNNPPRPRSGTDGTAWNIDSKFLQNPDQNGHNLLWNSATNWFSGVWIKEQLELKLTNQNDGYIKLWDNGVLRINYLGPTDTYPGTSRNDAIGGYARDFGNSSNWRYFADCYLDYTPSRVVLANNSNIDNATIIENQIPSAWSATSITATVNMGQFTTGTAYLFVYDSTGAHNTTGYPITLSGPSLPTVTIAATTPNASETGPVNGVFTVTRTGSTGSSLTVNYGVSGSATNGTDYSTLSGSVTIPSGSSTATITVVPVDDSLVEGPETVNLTLMVTTNYIVNTSSGCRATVTITDNDGSTAGGLIVNWGATGADNVYGTGFDTPFLTGAPNTTYSSAGPAGIVGPWDGTQDVMGVKGTGISGTGRMFNVNDQIVVTWYNTSGSSITITPQVSLNTFFAGGEGTWYNMSAVTIPANSTNTSTYTIDATTAGTHATVAVCRHDSGFQAALCDKIDIVAANGGGLPTVTIAATTRAASETGPVNGVFTVTRTGSTTSALTVNYAINGSATNGTDYTPTLSGSITIPSGSATANITITPVDDSICEGPETVVLTISTNANYNVGSPSSDTVVIADNDPPTVTIVATTPNASEIGLVNGQFTVTRTGPTTSSLAVNYAVTGSAVSGRDYTALSGTVTIASGSSTATVTVTPIDNGLLTGALTVVSTISTNVNYIVGNPSNDTVTIADAEAPTVTIAATTSIASETGPTNGQFTVTRTGATTNSLVVNYAISGTATNTTDYSTLSGSVTINSGSSTATITVTPVDDSIAEGLETVILTISSNANYNIGSPSSATVYIEDNDLTTLVDFGSTAGANIYGPLGWQTVTLGMYRVYSSAGPGGINGSSNGSNRWQCISGSPNHTFNVGDQIIVTWYNGHTSTLTFTPVVSFTRNGDTTSGTWYPMTTVTSLAVGALATSTFTFDGTNAGSYGLVNTCDTVSNATGLMCDKIELAPASLPTVTISATTPTASENGPTNGVFTVTRNGPTTSSLVVNYAISGTATNGTDYSTLSGTVTINSGSSTATITVTPLGDSLIEGNETVILNISANANYTVGTPSSATVTIADNDYLLVDFGSSAAGNVYGTSWNNPIIGRFSFYSTISPYGVKAGSTGHGHSGGISVGTGTSYTFTQGQQVVVTWYNTATTAVTFTPQVSFDDTNDPDVAPNGTWYPMSTVTSLQPSQSGTSTYTIDATTAGMHTVVNVCRIKDGNDVALLILDKIQLLSPDGGGMSPMILTGGGGAGAMKSAAQQPAQSTKTSLLPAPASQPATTLPPPRKLVGWTNSTPPAATKK